MPQPTSSLNPVFCSENAHKFLFQTWKQPFALPDWSPVGCCTTLQMDLKKNAGMCMVTDSHFPCHGNVDFPAYIFIFFIMLFLLS